MFYLGMSTEQLSKKNATHLMIDPEDISSEFENKITKKNKKVDINLLMDKVREEKKKEKKENLIFISLIASVVLITGAIASF